MNNLHEQKYGAKPEEIEKNSPSSEAYKERFDFHRLEKISGEKAHQDTTKKYKLKSPLELGEEVLILTGRLKKKDSLGKFYKSSVENKSCFYKKEIFLITRRQIIDGKFFYWLKSTKNGKKLNKKFQREKNYSLSGNFIWFLCQF